MVSDTSILDPIRQSNQFGQLPEQLNHDWEAEQRRRHSFWAKHDEGIKAEFINGAVLYDSPVYGRLWQANSNIIQRLLPFVAENKSAAVPGFSIAVETIFNDPL